MNNYQSFLQKGKQVELNFANKHLTDFILADKEEDIFEHWDVKGICAVISLNSLKERSQSGTERSRNSSFYNVK